MPSAPRNNRLFFIVALAFLLAFMLVRHYSTGLSDKPLVIHGQNPPEILMFGTQSCPYCAEARAFFAKHKLAYTEKDIEKSDSARNMFYLLGGRGTPLIIVNGVALHGFDEQMLRETLAGN